MDKMETGSKFKNLILNIILIAVAIFASFKIYGLHEGVIGDLQQKREVEIKRNDALSSISSLEKKIVVYQDFFNKKDLTAMISNLGEIAKSSNVRIISIKPGIEQKTLVYSLYPYSLSVEAANYHVLAKFISNLESHKDIYAVDSASITSRVTGGDSDQAMINADLQVSTIMVNK